MTTKAINSIQFLETSNVLHYWLEDGIVADGFANLWMGEALSRFDDELDYLAICFLVDGTISILIHCVEGGSEVYSGLNPKTVKINDRHWWQKLLID